MIFSPAFLTTTKLFARWLVNKIIQMIPSAFEDFREVWPRCEDTKRQICTTRIVVTVTFAHRLCVEQTREQQAALATAMYYMPYMTINDFSPAFLTTTKLF